MEEVKDTPISLPDMSNGRAVSIAENLLLMTDDINGQNVRYTSSEELDHDGIREMAQAGIKEEQEETFLNLIKLSLEIPYEYLAANSLVARSRYDKLASNPIQIDDEVKAKSDHIDSVVEDATRLSPSRSQAIEELGIQEKQKLLDNSRLRIEQKLAELTKVALAYDGLIETLGEAWPIPNTLSAEDRRALFEMAKEEAQSNLMVEDFVPVTPTERDAYRATVERASHVVHNKNASEYIKFYLQENIDKIVSVEELARFLYDTEADEQDSYNLRNRVTTLLGPKVNGKLLQARLVEEGFKLQWGLRIIKEIRGDKTVRVSSRPRRIYRLVKLGSELDLIPSTAGTLVHSGKNMGVEDYWDDHKTTETQPLDIVDMPTTQQAEAVTEELAKELDSSEDPEKTDWREELKENCHKVIDRLIDDKLFEEDDMLATYVANTSTSKSLGTLKGRELLVSAKLMTRSEFNRRTMNRHQRVISALFNSNKGILSGGVRQKQALHIIDTIIEERLSTLAHNS